MTGAPLKHRGGYVYPLESQNNLFLFDGAQEVLSILLGSAHDYQQMMMERIEVEIPVSQIEFFFRNEPLDPETLFSVSASADPISVFAECQDIGYPIAFNRFLVV